MLEANNGIVREADDDDVPLRILPLPATKRSKNSARLEVEMVHDSFLVGLLPPGLDAGATAVQFSQRLSDLRRCPKSTCDPRVKCEAVDFRYSSLMVTALQLVDPAEP